MADETTPAGTPTQAPAPSAEPQTIDEVYSKFNVEEDARQFRESASPTPAPQQQPQQQPSAPQSPNIPDPVLDQQGFRQFISTNQHETQNLRQALANIQGHLGNMQRAALLQREEHDIKQAVEAVNANLDNKLDPDVVEIGLGQMARKDPKFMAVYQNRYKNPAAWNAALKVASKSLGSKFAMRSDPQIAENVRALKDATSGRATSDNPPANSAQERLQKAVGADFDREWARMRGNKA